MLLLPRVLVVWSLLLLAAGASEGFEANLGVLVRLHNQDLSELGTSWNRIAGACLMAVRHINDRDATLCPLVSSLPAGFNVSADMKDTDSLPSTGVSHAVTFSQNKVHAVVGPPRSAVSGPVTLVSQMDDTPVISYWSTSARLADKSVYPYFSRVIPSDKVVAGSMVKVCAEFQWKSIGVLYIDDSYGAGYAQDISSAAGSSGISVAVSQKFTSDDDASIGDAISAIVESGVRIIIVITFSNDVETIALKAHEAGIMKKGYVWITADAVSGPGEVLGASTDPRLPGILKGFLQLLTDPLYGDRKARFQASWTAEPKAPLVTKIRDYVPTLPSDDLDGVCDDLCGYAYDSVMSAALSIAAVAPTSGALDKGALNQKIRELSFQGATGTIVYESTGDRSAQGLTIVLKNWVPSSDNTDNVQLLGSYDPDNGFQKASDTVPIWFGGQETWEIPIDPSSCGTGTIFSDDVGACVPCQPGTVQVGVFCVPCQIGTYMPVAGGAKCLPCSDGYSNQTGMVECHRCPLHTSRRPNSPGVNKSECLCDPGYYAKQGIGESCDACITGGECPGGTEPPYPIYGFWGDRECSEFGGNKTCKTFDMFRECQPRSDCPGGAEFSCKLGRKGQLCREPDDGWFVIGGSFYESCGDNGELVTVLGILGVITVWFGINTLASANYDAMDIALLFVQVTGMISTYGLNWHRNLDDVNTALGIANFDVDFVAPNCLGVWTESSSFYLQLSLPFVVAICWLLYYLVDRAIKVNSKKDKDEEDKSLGDFLQEKMISKLFSFAIVVYHTLCLKCFRVFNCIEYPDGNQYMKFAPEQQCWTATHNGMVATAAVYIPLIIGGVPATILYVIYKYKKQGSMHDLEVRARYGFLYDRYEADWMWWEVMLILRRLVVSFLSIAVDTSMLQAGVTMFFLAIFLSCHVYTKPYVSSTIDFLDFFSILGSMFYVLSGLLFYPSLTAQAQGHICSGEATDNDNCQGDAQIKDNISIFLLIWLSLTLAVAVYSSYTQIRELVSSKNASVMVHTHIAAIEDSQVLKHSLDAAAKLMRRTSSLAPKDLTKVENTANKIQLDELILGPKLLNWAKQLSQKGKDTSVHPDPESAVDLHNDIAEAFMIVDQRLRALRDDVTHYSDSHQAKILRKLSELPEVVDWLSHEASEDDRLHLKNVVDRLSAFYAKRAGTHPIKDTLIENYYPVAISYLTQCKEPERHKFVMLMDAILEANGIKVIDVKAIDCSTTGNGSSVSLPDDKQQAGGKQQQLEIPEITTVTEIPPAPNSPHPVEKGDSGFSADAAKNSAELQVGDVVEVRN